MKKSRKVHLRAGVKYDTGKLRWCLVPWAQMKHVVRVLMFGAQKYDDYNWQLIGNPSERYLDAALRHVLAWAQGERYDPESHLPHLAHAICCLLFALWFDDQKIATVFKPTRKAVKHGCAAE